MKANHMKIIRGLLFVALFAPALGAWAALAIIAHPSNTAVGLTADEIAMIYLGKTQSFPNGRSAVPLDQSAGSSSRATFLEKVLNKNEAALKAYWSKLMFSGKGSPPPEIGDDQAVKTWVAKNPNAIGYVDGKVLDNSVKVLLIIPGP